MSGKHAYRGAMKVIKKFDEMDDIGTIDDIMQDNAYHSPTLPEENNHSKTDREPLVQASSKNIQQLITIDPKKCRPWKYADRLPEEMGNIEELANAIKNNGQQEPVLLRPIIDGGDELEYEVIFGNRRWRACTLINIPLLGIVKELSDQDAATAQKEENENREGLSTYARAMSYKRLINDGIFTNENQLSIKLNIPKNTLNDLMSYTRIPQAVLNNIPSVHKLSQRLAVKLATLSKDEALLPILVKLGPEISNKAITTKNIELKIKDIQSGSNSFHKKSTPVIGKGGAEIFTIREDSNGAPCIVLHKAARNAIDLPNLEQLIKNYIDECIDKKHNHN